MRLTSMTNPRKTHTYTQKGETAHHLQIINLHEIVHYDQKVLPKPTWG